MLILEFKGGLGNQMFQYAFYKNLLYHKKEVSCKITNTIGDRPFKLDHFPGVSFEKADDVKYDELKKKYVDRCFIEKVVDKISGGSGRYYYHENERKKFDKKLYKFDDIILSGYFQSEIYFRAVKEQVRKDLVFPYGEKKLQDIISSLTHDSVSIHIRRGDYLDDPHIYGDICTLRYYRDAIAYISNMMEARYIVLSDDIQWAEHNLHLPDAMYVEKDMFDDHDDWYDMCIMSRCHHNIIANSSFSWWGGWLNGHPDKIVIAPPYFDNRYKHRSLACDDWVTMKG